MNKIEITGKITGELQYAQYPNGNKIVNFGFESFSKRKVNKFRVSASGKKVEIIEKAAEKGEKICIIGEVRTGTRQVAGASVIKDGKVCQLYLPFFNIETIAIGFPE